MHNNLEIRIRRLHPHGDRNSRMESKQNYSDNGVPLKLLHRNVFLTNQRNSIMIPFRIYRVAPTYSPTYLEQIERTKVEKSSIILQCSQLLTRY